MDSVVNRVTLINDLFKQLEKVLENLYFSQRSISKLINVVKVS